MPQSRSEEEVLGIEPLMQASKVIVAVVAHSLAEVGADVSIPQLRVLVMVASHGPMNVSSLAQGLGVNPSNASRTCDRMVARGLLTRRADERDRRHLVLELSPEGQNLLDRILDHRRSALRQVVRRMSASRRRRLQDGMTAFVSAAHEVSEAEGVGDGEGGLVHWLV